MPVRFYGYWPAPMTKTARIISLQSTGSNVEVEPPAYTCPSCGAKHEKYVLLSEQDAWVSHAAAWLDGKPVDVKQIHPCRHRTADKAE